MSIPRYLSHKTVSALEIKAVAGLVLSFVEEEADLTVDPAMFARYTPVAGDFLVFYEDGYHAISPRAPFLNGYTRLED